MEYERKYQNRINWQNMPSISTPLNATNLNKMDVALQYMDGKLKEAVDSGIATPNPSGTATENLTKLGIGDTIYNISGGDIQTYTMTDIPTPSPGSRWTIASASNTWLRTDEYYGTLINLSDYKVYRSIRVYRSDSGHLTDVAFLKTDSQVEGNVPDYCAGWKKVVYLEDGVSEFRDIPIPSDANYLYVYMASLDTVYTPDKIDFIDRDELDFIRTIDANAETINSSASIIKGTAHDTLKLATFNIGHFSDGNYPYSVDTYTARLNEYKQLIYNTINPDVIAVQEYSDYMVDKGKTSQVLFNDFQVQYEGVQRNYSCNAIFDNTCLLNMRKHEFECLANEEITHTDLIKAQDYYYVDADLYIKGRLVKFVATHLAFDSNRPMVLQDKQIAELISAYANYEYVIMMGDFNSRTGSGYDPFVNAGYNLVNDGSYLTSENMPLDNIVVKGLTISDAGMITTDLSDHNPLFCTVSLNQVASGGSTMSKTRYTVSSSSWSATQDASGYYTYSLSLSTALSTSFAPNVYISGANDNTFATDTEQGQFDLLDECKLVSSSSLTLYAKTKPTSNFYVYVEGVNS